MASALATAHEGRVVHRDVKRIAAGTRLDVIRPADQQRNVHCLRVGDHFVEASVAAVHLPMVRGKDDDGVFIQSLRLQVVQDPADIEVDLFNDVAV